MRITVENIFMIVFATGFIGTCIVLSMMKDNAATTFTKSIQGYQDGQRR